MYQRCVKMVRVRGRLLGGAAIVAAAALLVGQQGARADTALVVGVASYPNLPPENQLQGPANDAGNMAAALKKNGFTVKLITNAEATKAAILAALAEAARTTKSSERFVLFFAGHGSDSPRSILPYDAKRGENVSENPSVITRAELHTAVSAIHAASHTMILDACFSGGMRDADVRLTELGNGRFVDLVDGHRGTPNPNNSDGARMIDDSVISGPAGTPPPPRIRVLAAAKENQKAYEYPYNGGPKQGIFTHNLLPYLDPSAPRVQQGTQGTQGTSETLTKIKQAVEKTTLRHQLPLAVGIEENEPLLGGKPTDTHPEGDPGGIKPVTVKDVSLWDSFYAERPNPDFVQVTVYPIKTDFAVGEPFIPTLRTSTEGYVMLLEKDAEGTLSLLFPSENSVEKCHIRKNEERSLGQIAEVAAGIGTFKAIHFTDEALARRFLDNFFKGSSGGSQALTEEGAKAARVVIPADFRFFTSQFTLSFSKDDPKAKRAGETAAK